MAEENHNENNVTEHSLENVWTSLRHTQNQVGVIGAKLDSVISGVEKLTSTVNSILSQPKKETNWIGIGSLLIAIIIMAGTYTQARLSPIESDVSMLTDLSLEHARMRVSAQYDAGKRDGKLESIELTLKETVQDLHRRMLSVEDEASANAATVGNLTGWVEQLDLHGSRKHVMSAPDASKRRTE